MFAISGARSVARAQRELAAAGDVEAVFGDAAGDRHERQHGYVAPRFGDAEMAQQERCSSQADDDPADVAEDPQRAAADDLAARLGRAQHVLLGSAHRLRCRRMAKSKARAEQGRSALRARRRCRSRRRTLHRAGGYARWGTRLDDPRSRGASSSTPVARKSSSDRRFGADREREARRPPFLTQASLPDAYGSGITIMLRFFEHGWFPCRRRLRSRRGIRALRR